MGGLKISDELAEKIKEAKKGELNSKLKKKKLAPLTATVEKITTDGVLKMSFSRDIHIEKGLGLPDSKQIDVKMSKKSAVKGRRLNADGDDEENDDFTSETKSFDSKELAV